MKFCDVCENLYYFKISDDDKMSLNYYCRKCGDTKIQDVNECIKEVTYTKEDYSDQEINTLLKYDPTIPFSTHIKCPNSSCQTNNPKDKSPSKVIYYRYDEENLKYIYMCTVCESSWKP